MNLVGNGSFCTLAPLMLHFNIIMYVIKHSNFPNEGLESVLSRTWKMQQWDSSEFNIQQGLHVSAGCLLVLCNCMELSL